MINEVDLVRIRHWFETYVRQFFTGDSYIDSALRIKVEHTHNVANESCRIADSLDMNTQQCYLAEIIAVLHDIGRFEQFSRYHTYADSVSEDHAHLGAQIVKENGLLDIVTGKEQELIRNVIAFHNRAVVPENGDRRFIHHLRLLRDADKIDILRVVTEYYAGYCRNNAVGIGFPDSSGVTDTVLRNVRQGEIVNIHEVKNLNDLKLMQVSWIYDCNFPYTFFMMNKRKYLDKMTSVLPYTDDVRQAIAVARRHLEDHCGIERKNRKCRIL